MSRRPGFVLEVDRSTPPTLFWNGERFTLETLPEGSRVIYAPEPIEALDDPVARHPPRPAPPGRRPRSAAGAAACRHEAHDLLRRHLAAPATHGGTRHPPAGHREGARPGRRRRGRRRRADRRPRPAPAHDRGRAAPRPGRPDLRRLRPPRPAHPARRRGPRQPHPPRADRTGRGRRDQQAGGHHGPAGLRQHQPGGHGRRAQERGHRAGQLQEPAPPPQPPDHAAQPLVHGRPRLGAAHLQLAHGPATSPTAGSRSSRSRPPSTPTPSRRRSPSCRSAEWEWSLRDRATYAATSARSGPPRGGPSDLPLDQVAPRHDLGAGRRGGGGARRHHRERVAPAGGRGRRARPTS